MKTIHFSDDIPSLDISRDVFIHPTNSCYGIGANIYNEAGYEMIYTLKGREKSKPFFITIPDIRDIEKYAVYDTRIEAYLDKYPAITFTFILTRNEYLPQYINPGFLTIGIQIAKGKLKTLCDMAGGAMFGTSANITAEEPIYNPQRIHDVFGDVSDILFFDDGELSYSEPSTIIDFTGIEPILLRGSLS